MKILVADNDRDILEIITMTLREKARFDVETAENGDQALNMVYENNDYDLLVFDIMMPGKSGIDTCKEIVENKKLKKKPPVILISALPVNSSAFKDSMKKFKELSIVKGVIEKPFDVKELIEKVNEVIVGKKSKSNSVLY